MRYGPKLEKLVSRLMRKRGEVEKQLSETDIPVAVANDVGQIDLRRKEAHARDIRMTISSEVEREQQKRRVTKEDYDRAVTECTRAMTEWKIAQHKLDWVVEPDQIDYTIYSVIAAEKQYATLLKEAKRMHKQLFAEGNT